MISKGDSKLLLELARDAIITAFSREEPEIDKVKKFSEKKGVFVTLYKNNQLRGCIGFPEPIYPLYKGIIEAARAAAFDDPRFPPVQKEEMKDIKIEISILTKPELISVESSGDYLKQIKIGQDGLIIRSPMGSGLLLPQVPVEYNWDVKEFLEQLCQKAWLPPDAWKDLNNKIYKFQAEIIREEA